MSTIAEQIRISINNQAMNNLYKQLYILDDLYSSNSISELEYDTLRYPIEYELECLSDI